MLSIIAQVCAINKALMRVKKVMWASNRVVFDEEEMYVKDKVTGPPTMAGCSW